MSLTTRHDSVPRPPSPRTGSRHQTRHRWQLDPVSSLAEATQALRDLAAELTAAHAAGWWLVEPMRSGHLLAARASRRQRAHQAPDPPPPTGAPPPPVHRWRLRVVDEPPAPGHQVFVAALAIRTPILAWTGRSLDQLGGPDVAPEVLADVVRQVAPTGLALRRWALAPARVGRNYDLVADGSALRLHAVEDGALVRTHETLMFQHAADGATTLLKAAAAYERLARIADAAAAAGGRLTTADDGLLDIAYHRPG